jgi:hypothetical protein
LGRTLCQAKWAVALSCKLPSTQISSAIAYFSIDQDKVNLVYLLHLTIITRTTRSHPLSLDLPHHEHTATETSKIWAMKQQTMHDHRPQEEIPMAKSITNMKRPIDSSANLSLLGGKGSLLNELSITNLYPDTIHIPIITNTTKRHHDHMILVPDHYITLVRHDLYSVIALYEPTSSLV